MESPPTRDRIKEDEQEQGIDDDEAARRYALDAEEGEALAYASLFDVARYHVYDAYDEEAGGWLSRE